MKGESFFYLLSVVYLILSVVSLAIASDISDSDWVIILVLNAILMILMAIYLRIGRHRGEP